MNDHMFGAVDFNRSSEAPVGGAPAQPAAWRGRAVAAEGGLRCTVIGTPRLSDARAARIAQDAGTASALLHLWRTHGASLPASLEGGYALAIEDREQGCAFLAVDRFAIQTLCYSFHQGVLVFSDRADTAELGGSRLDPQAVFEYLFFHMIPAPRTVFKGIARLPAGHSALVSRAGIQLARHAGLRFDVDSSRSFAEAKSRFIDLLEQSVRDALPPEGPAGAFLSGGTDSSTVVGMIGRATGRKAKAFSIGFDAEGYDEMAYARLAARHFGAEHHEYYVTHKDLLDSIPAVASHHDQPFGNSSALPAYYCARMARENGCQVLLAGDGGDELFGGNSRYAMQVFLDYYRVVPAGLRRVVEPWCGEQSRLRSIPGLRQLMGYVRHASVPMPRRMQGTNLLMELGPSRIFTPEFGSALDHGSPQAHMEATWQACEDSSVLNRMLAFDWVYTLADSDLPKVRGAIAMAGMDVSFPLLDDRLVAFSMTLPQNWKLNRFRLRWFFKEALRGFLPDEIITKTKHGFGLPHGRWMATDAALRDCARDALAALVQRRIIQAGFVDELIDRRLPTHPGYYGEMVWILMMLEHWLRAHPRASW